MADHNETDDNLILTTPEQLRAVREALDRIPPSDKEKLDRAFAKAEEEARAIAEAAKHQTFIIPRTRYRA